MKIYLEHISKRFQRHWIFKDINTAFLSANAYAILGANGSGKSTLMRVIAGIQNPSVGKVKYSLNDTEIKQDKIFSYVSFCAPSQEIVEEFTLSEFLNFHFSFKQIHSNLSVSDIIDLTGLDAAKDKQIADYSSGMKQRVKLAQAIFTDSPILLLDEPCTNLDDNGVKQYHSWIAEFTKDKLVIVASNDNKEYSFCKNFIQMQDYK